MKPALSLAPLLLLLLAARSAAQAPSPPHVQCAERLAAMSSCLPRVAALPENATSTPSATCCQDIATATDDADGGASCLCDLIRTPSLLGSQIDTSRLVSFLSSCGIFDSVNDSSNFVENCQDSSAKAQTKFPPPPATALGAISSADDSEADESGSEDPDPNRSGRRRRPPARPSPSPPRPNPPPSHPPPPRPTTPPPEPAPPLPEPAPPCPTAPTVPDVDDGRRELPFRGALLLLLPILALC